MAIICSSEEIAGKLVLQASKAVRAVCGFSSALLHCKCHSLYFALTVAMGSVSKSKYKSSGLKSFSQSLVMFAGNSILNLAARFCSSPNRNHKSITTASRVGKNTLSLKQRTSVYVLNILYPKDCFWSNIHYVILEYQHSTKLPNTNKTWLQFNCSTPCSYLQNTTLNFAFVQL